MNIYLVTWAMHRSDCYYSMVVVAGSEQDALSFHPDRESVYDEEDGEWVPRNSEGFGYVAGDNPNGTWPKNRTHLSVKQVGVALEGQVAGVLAADFDLG